MTQFDTYIFDLDGTLIHSAPDIQAAINSALKSANREPLDIATVISFIGNCVEKLVERSLRATGSFSDERQAETLAHFMDAYNAVSFSRTKPYPGVLACLETLRADGKKLAICTNKPAGAAKTICDALEITAYFDLIAGAEPGIPKKPDPTPLERVIKTLGARKGTSVYVGDSTVDQATAHNADVPFVLFSGGYLNAELTAPLPILTFDTWDQDWIDKLGGRN